MSATIHSDNIGSFQVFLGWGAGNESWDGAEFRVSAVGNLQYGVHDGFAWHHVEAKPAVNLLDGHEHVVTMVRDPRGGTQIYVNGTRVGYGWIGGNPRLNLTTAKSARHLYAYKDMAFLGNVTQVFVYDRDLQWWEVPKLPHVACREKDPAMTHLDFSNSVMYSNIGGLGPDFLGAGRDANDTKCKKSLRLTDVATYGGVVLDLLVTNMSEYEPKDPSMNGLFRYGEGLAHINLRAGSSVDLRFELVSHMSCFPVRLDNFYFTFADIDSGPLGTGRETLAITSDVENYYVSEDTLLGHTWPGSDANLVVWATDAAAGNDTDNPESGVDLADAQEQRGVAFVFAGTSGFDATLAAAPGVGGRDFSFCGWSSIVLDGFNSTLPQGPPQTVFEEVKYDHGGHLATGDGQLAGTWET